MESKLQSLSWQRVFLLVLHYFLGYGFLYRQIGVFLTLANDPYAIMILPSIQLCIYLFTLAITIWLAYPLLKKGFIYFKAHLRYNLLLVLVLICATYFANLILSILIGILTGMETTQNQQAIEASSRFIPLLTLFSTCFFAPIVEECVFRGGVFTKLRSKTSFLLASLISSLLFGNIHFINTFFTLDFSDLPFLLVYSGIGMVLAYGYEKSNTIFVPILLHFLNNLIAVLAMLL